MPANRKNRNLQTIEEEEEAQGKMSMAKNRKKINVGKKQCKSQKIEHKDGKKEPTL